jgi:hypothetical protein
MNYDTISKRSQPSQQTSLWLRDLKTALRYSCEQILESSAAHFLDLTGTLGEKGMSYWFALSELTETSRLVSSFKEDMPPNWINDFWRSYTFWAPLVATTATTYTYCDNIRSHVRKTKAMAKSPNFLLRTTMPWEKISLRLDLLSVLGPVSWNRNIITWGLFFVLQCIHLSLYCDAGERVLKQINLGIRRTVVFFFEVSGTPKTDPCDLFYLSIIPTYRRYLTGQAHLAHIADPCACACITSLHSV